MNLLFRNTFNKNLQSFFILTILNLFSLTPLIASDSLRFINNLKLGVELNYGYVYPHTTSIKYELKENIYGLKMTLSTDAYGRTAWDKLFRYPHYGAGLLTTTLGNDEVFGRANALFLFTDIPFTSKKRRLTFNYEIDFGFAYLTKKFDIEKNSMNIAISSNFNFYGAFELNARYHLDENNELKAGINLSHFSNGKLNTPNLGINSVKMCIVYYHTIMPARYERRIPPLPEKSGRHNLDLVLSAGSKADDQITGKRYLISSFVADYKYKLSLRYAMGAGADAFYDQSLGPNKIAGEGGTYSRIDLYQAAIHASMYVQYSKLTILTQVGEYVYADYYKYSRMFFRIGFRYKLYRNLFFNLTLKSHYAIADYVEWGIGYRFE